VTTLVTTKPTRAYETAGYIGLLKAEFIRLNIEGNKLKKIYYRRMKTDNRLKANKVLQCVRKVAVHLQNVLEVMFTSIYTDLK
jgi:hypothetical protein